MFVFRVEFEIVSNFPLNNSDKFHAKHNRVENIPNFVTLYFP